ncbi:hypothetical protein SAMN05421837_101595 [Amycolatopsis pretoriensis]|uniref:YbaB/EbfC DNA-binding family protein n=1 Tax=Amycolatopsis pretoriensis TaxID=218821 RepID=A0A1H5Q429_9PSEU|nr:hypothetical protein [Amycolatopsis pretoriensis]SEF20882.1 hypothetical protein SAMN05421837_101595 [Amycolatopsis pretoriensis]
MNDSRTASELADDAFAAEEPGFGARLAAIRAAAAEDGVSVVVDLHGALVDLRFDRWALNKSPGELAGLIRRLASEAGAETLRQGRELLGDLLPGEGPRIGPRPVSVTDAGPRIRPREHTGPDDSFLPATWAT